MPKATTHDGVKILRRQFFDPLFLKMMGIFMFACFLKPPTFRHQLLSFFFEIVIFIPLIEDEYCNYVDLLFIDISKI